MTNPDYTKLDAYGPLRLRSGAGGDYKNGLCVMEAVAWLASESATDKPECACPVLGSFAIRLNDAMDDEARQNLLPLALPMTGTRSPDHERERAEYITLRVIREILPVTFRAIGLKDHADHLASAKTLSEAGGAAADAAHAARTAADADAAHAARTAAHAAYATRAATAYATDATAYAADAARAAARAARAATDYAARAAAHAARQELLLNCIPILQGAIELGPNAGDQWPALKPRAEELGAFARQYLETVGD